MQNTHFNEIFKPAAETGLTQWLRPAMDKEKEEGIIVKSRESWRERDIYKKEIAKVNAQINTE